MMQGTHVSLLQLRWKAEMAKGKVTVFIHRGISQIIVALFCLCFTVF